jgi:nucleoside phosphorylase/CheY-like chemotaxis protein
MPKILLVEDDQAKAQRITKAILDVPSITRDDIDRATNLHEARKYLRANAYDLLVLDLVVPEFGDSSPIENGGVRLLEELRASPDRFVVPSWVVGITQFDELKGNAERVFRQGAMSLLAYGTEDNSWVEQIQAAVRYTAAARSSRVVEEASYQCKLAVVCALPMELEAVRRLSWNLKLDPLEGDPTNYWSGEFPDRTGGKSRVIAAAAPRMGMAVSAAIASKIIQRFRPEYIAMVGIAAGIDPTTVNLGEVLLGDPVWDYGSGKWTSRDGERKFAMDPDPVPLDRTVRAAIELVGYDKRTLDDLREAFQGPKPPHPLRICPGPVASGAAVVTDAVSRQHILDQNRKTVGLEMEAYGIYVAAREAAAPRPKAFALKTVVDHANPVKEDRYQPYGAYASAQVLRLVAERVL